MIQRIAILVSVIIPLIGLIASCCHTEGKNILAAPILPLSSSAIEEETPPLEIIPDLTVPSAQKEEEVHDLLYSLEPAPVEANYATLETDSPSGTQKVGTADLSYAVLAGLRQKIKIEMPKFYELMVSKSRDEGDPEPDCKLGYLQEVANELDIEIIPTEILQITLRDIQLKLTTKYPELNDYISLGRPKNLEGARLFGYFVAKDLGPNLEDPSQRCLVVIYKNEKDESLYSFRPGSRNLYQWAICPKVLKDTRDLVRTEEEFARLGTKTSIYVSSTIPPLPIMERAALNHQFSNFFHSGPITAWAALLALILPQE